MEENHSKETLPNCQVNFVPNPLALPQALGGTQAAAVGGQKRRGGAQDQDRGTVADLRNHCKLICIEVNEKDTFPVPKYMNLIYVI